MIVCHCIHSISMLYCHSKSGKKRNRKCLQYSFYQEMYRVSKTLDRIHIKLGLHKLSRCPKLDGFGVRVRRLLKCEFYSNDILQDDVKEQWNSCMQNEAASKPIPLLPQLPNYSKAVQQKLRNFLLAKAFSEDCYSLMNFRW